MEPAGEWGGHRGHYRPTDKRLKSFLGARNVKIYVFVQQTRCKQIICLQRGSAPSIEAYQIFQYIQQLRGRDIKEL